MKNQTTAAWLATVGLAGSALGVLEALLWQVKKGFPTSLTESVLVLAWGSVAYLIPALIMAGAWILIAKIRNHGTEPATGTPGPLISFGVFVAVVASSVLRVEGLLRFLVELPASIALAVGLCFFLRSKWPSILNSVRTWLLLDALVLSAAASLLAWKYATGGQMLAMLLVVAVAVVCCLWGLTSSARRDKGLIGATSLVIVVLVLHFLWPEAHSQVTANVSEQRNVLLITIDTLRADHLGSYGYTKGQTPTIDEMSAEGVVFREAHSQTGYTCPSHASILTGLDPLQHGTIDNAIPLRVDVPILPEMLSRQGYETAAFVSGFTLKHEACNLGNRFLTYDDDFSPWRWLPQSAARIFAVQAMSPLAKHLGFYFWSSERRAEETTDAALKWLEGSRRRPFFLWVHYFDAHIPYDPPPPYDRLFDPDYAGTVNGHWYELSLEAKMKIVLNPADVHHMITRYDGEIAYVDSQISRLREALVRLGLDRNTLVILTADHGESHGDHNIYFDRDLHRPTLHVPLIINFPDGEVEPRSVSEQVRLIDIAPTIMDYLQIGTDVPFGGKSLLTFVRGDGDKDDRPVFALHPLDDRDAGIMFALQDKGYKLIWYSGILYGERSLWALPWEELYHVQSDPEEKSNILEQTPLVLPDLRRRLTVWRSQEIPDRTAPTGEVRSVLKSLGYVQ